MKALTFKETLQAEIQKFNPYHDRLGRFTTSGGAASFTYKPGASRAHDLAIERERKRTASGGGSEVKAISIDMGNGKKMTLRQRSDGALTDITGNKVIYPASEKRSLSDFAAAAEKKGYKVTNHSADEIKEKDDKRYGNFNSHDYETVPGSAGGKTVYRPGRQKW